MCSEVNCVLQIAKQECYNSLKVFGKMIQKLIKKIHSWINTDVNIFKIQLLLIHLQSEILRGLLCDSYLKTGGQ